MAVRIISRFVRGRVFYQIADVLFPPFAQAAGAWSAAVARFTRGDIVANVKAGVRS